MRICADLVNDVHDAVSAGKAHTVQAFCRAVNEGVASSTSFEMMGKFLGSYMSTMKVFHAGKGDLGLSADGTRVGNPGEECFVQMHWCCEKKQSSIPPIKVYGKIH